MKGSTVPNRRAFLAGLGATALANRIPTLNEDDSVEIKEKLDDPVEKLFIWSNDWPEWKFVEFRTIKANDIFRFSRHKNAIYVAYYDWTERGVRGQRIEDIRLD